MKPCRECDGRGEVMGMEVCQHGRFSMTWDICPACGGTGHTPEPGPVGFVMQARLFDEPLLIAIRSEWASAA